MATPIVHTGATVRCAHGGAAQVVSLDARVLVEGHPVAALPAVCVIASCPASPQPCVTGRWLTGASRVLVSGQPAVTAGGTSACEPGGAPLVAAPSGRVVAS